MGHFRCSVERIKRFVHANLHCIVSNIPSKGRKNSGPPELLRSEISLLRSEISVKSRALATFQSNGKARKQVAI